MFFFFFFIDPATTEIYTLSLHDALPICRGPDRARPGARVPTEGGGARGGPLGDRDAPRRGPRGGGAAPRGRRRHRGRAPRARPPLSLLLQRAGRPCHSA